MAYKKFSANSIFDGTALLDDKQVLVMDDHGVVQEIVHRNDAGDDILELKGILTPGFINAHCHLELSHMKDSIPMHTGLLDFVFNVMSNRHMPEAEMLAAIEKADKAMREEGIVAVGDICNNALTVQQKKLSTIHYHNFIEVAGFAPEAAVSRFEKANEVLDVYHSALHDQDSVVTPHAPYSVSAELFSLINAATANKLISIHNQETEAENDFYLHKSGDFLRLYETLGLDISFFKASGKTSVQTWLPYFDRQQSLLLVHNLHTSQEDLAFMQQALLTNPHSIHFCLCPNANLYISNQLPDVGQLIQQGCNIVLGTDSLASNQQLSIVAEMRTLRKHFPGISLTQLLQWATINGARALQVEDRFGSFEKGKRPGLVLLSTDLSTAKRLY